MPLQFLRRKVLLAGFVVLGGFPSLIPDLRAGNLACGCRAGACGCVRRAEINGWKVLESQSFRVHHVGPASLAERIVPVCEQTRTALQTRWLGDAAKTGWSPKCDLFLYPTAVEFQRLTRVPAETMGYADLEIGEGKVWLRRLHVRADDTKRLDKLLVHELTHVVLADYFAEHQIPRWADEGIAILSEPVERRNELRSWLTKEATQGRVFSLRQLATQRQLPQDKRLGDLFYAQSSSLVEFLLSERELSGPQVLRFVAESETRGLEATLSHWFPDVASTVVESEWRQWMTKPRGGIQLAEDRVGIATPAMPAD